MSDGKKKSETKFGANFTNQVDQVHIGDAVSNGTPITNNNVLNFQLGREEKEKPPEFVTNHQKGVIMELVAQIAEMTGKARLAVIRVVLARAGAGHIKDILRDEYKDIEQYLSGWLRRVESAQSNSAISQSPAAIADSSIEAELIEQLSEYRRRESANNATLKATQSQLAAMRKRFGITATAGTLTLGAALGAGYYGWDQQKEAERLRETIGACSYDGKPYSIGSVREKSPGANVECVAGPNDKTPRWQPQKAKPRKK